MLNVSWVHLQIIAVEVMKSVKEFEKTSTHIWEKPKLMHVLFSLPTQGLRFKKAHVTHPELKATFCLPILGVKKNPSSPLYTTLGVITKGTVVEVNVSELGLVTQGGKVIWGECYVLQWWLADFQSDGGRSAVAVDPGMGGVFNLIKLNEGIGLPESCYFKPPFMNMI